MIFILVSKSRRPTSRGPGQAARLPVFQVEMGTPSAVMTRRRCSDASLSDCRLQAYPLPYSHTSLSSSFSSSDADTDMRSTQVTQHAQHRHSAHMIRPPNLLTSLVSSCLQVPSPLSTLHSLVLSLSSEYLSMQRFVSISTECARDNLCAASCMGLLASPYGPGVLSRLRSGGSDGSDGSDTLSSARSHLFSLPRSPT